MWAGSFLKKLCMLYFTPSCFPTRISQIKMSKASCSFQWSSLHRAPLTACNNNPFPLTLIFFVLNFDFIFNKIMFFLLLWQKCLLISRLFCVIFVFFYGLTRDLAVKFTWKHFSWCQPWSHKHAVIVGLLFDSCSPTPPEESADGSSFLFWDLRSKHGATSCSSFSLSLPQRQTAVFFLRLICFFFFFTVFRGM